MTRTATVKRTTRETDVAVTIDLDGTGAADVATGVGFFDHLLTSLAFHGMFDLEIAVRGDLEIDDHHTVEDTALVLGAGHRRGPRRPGRDRQVRRRRRPHGRGAGRGGRRRGRPSLRGGRPGVRAPSGSGTSPPRTCPTLSRPWPGPSGITLHLTATGRNDHHVAEAAFKALARALRAAVAPDPRRAAIPSTKGTT